ncbi:MAG: hypothetical protein ILP13_08160, partial [Lachnospiraceae bacterium]|nr:hypothetical protein [Lachnospiraceae bacterium]
GAAFALFIYESIIFNAVNGSDFAVRFLLITGILGAVVYIIRAAFLTPEERIKRCLCMFVTALGMYLANFIHTDYGATGVLTIVIIYVFARDRKNYAKNNNDAALSVTSVETVPGNPVKGLTMGILALTIMTPVEAFAFLDIIFVKRYGGERGRSLKYFFYAFYPVHLFIYYLITLALGAHRLPWT